MLLLLLITSTGLWGSFASEEPHASRRLITEREIRVDIPLESERILVHGEEKRYIPVGLEPLSSYELRVSYVSSHSVQIRFGYACDSTSTMDRKQYGRKLLHAEKMVFKTDAKAAVIVPPGEGRGKEERGEDPCGMAIMLTIQVFPWGMMRHAMNETWFEYDLVLEKNYLGVPVSSMPVLGMALCIVGVLVVSGVGWWMQLTKHWYIQTDDSWYHKRTG